MAEKTAVSRYVVLTREQSGDYKVRATVAAPSARAAKAAVLAELRGLPQTADDAPETARFWTMVAVPERSWNPETAAVQIQSRVVWSEDVEPEPER